MTIFKSISATAVVAGILATAGPCAAATAFQTWAQGRGTYVPSKERLSNYEDDLAGVGLLPPPERPGYRYRVLQQRYGVVGAPDEGY